MSFKHRIGDLLDKHSALFLTSAVLISAALGLARVWSLPASMEYGQTDNFWPIANHLLDGEGYSLCYPLYFPFCPQGDATPTAMREPVPVLIYAAVAGLSGRSLRVALHIQVLMCMLIVLLTHRFAKTMAGDRAGLLAAMEWAIYLPVVEIENQLSGDLIGTFFLMLSANALLAARRKRSLGAWVLAGGLLGAAALSRSAMVLMIIPWAAYACWTSSSGFSKQALLRSSLPLGLATVLVMMPWAIRNHQVFGRWWFGTSMNGYNVWRMNSLVGTSEPLHYVSSFEADSMSHQLLARRTDLRGDENEAEMDKVYLDEGMRQILRSPAKYLQLCAYRLFQLLTNVKVKSAYGVSPGPLDHIALLQQLIYLLLAGVGMMRWGRSQWPWVAAIAIQLAAYSALVAQWRYVFPIMPLFIAFAAAAAGQLIQGSGGRVQPR